MAVQNLVMLLISAAAASPPDPQQKVATARWMASNIEWGVLSTTSTRSEGSELGEAFGNPYSFADVNSGTPYFYASDLDASMIDLFTATNANQRATFAISEASLHNKSSSATQATCEIGTDLGDPENPPCARLVLSGQMVKLEKGSSEDKKARASLFARHPSFSLYPPGHGFYVVKMVVDGVWLIDFYGGAAIIPPETYLAANTSVGQFRGARQRYAMSALKETDVRPAHKEKVATARWMANTLTWGVLSTTSSRSQGTALGDAFGNPYAFADASAGVPYFYASNLDASMIDIFTASGANPKASFSLSEASLGGTSDSVKSCEIGALPLGDPENPPCARLVLTGTVQKLGVNTTEYTAGRASLFARHPSFANYPPGHDFFVAKMDVEDVWLIDEYGGAAIITPADYFAGKTSHDATLMLV